MNGSESKKITPVNFGFMLLFAICFDVLSIIPFLNIVVNFVAAICFAIWYFFSGISFSKNKGILGRGGVTFIVEMIPFLSIFPTWILYVTINYISINRKASKDGNAKKSLVDRRNAFQQLRDQRTHTAAEIHRLNRAREVMRTGGILPGENRDPVIASALEEFKNRRRKGTLRNSVEIVDEESPVQKTASQKDEERRSDPRQKAINAEEALRMKVNRTPDEQLQLRRAEEISKSGNTKQGEIETNPVYRAAYEKKTNPDNNNFENSDPVEY